MGRFPELTGRRWYSVALGERLYLLNLDSNSSLLPGSEQDKWLVQQLTALPNSTKFVFFNLHHPPVSDFQVDGDPDHNARDNEAALAQRLRDSHCGRANPSSLPQDTYTITSVSHKTASCILSRAEEARSRGLLSAPGKTSIAPPASPITIT